MKSGTNQTASGSSTKPPGNASTHQVKAQPTAEQIRYAKLAQFTEHEDAILQEKIKQVCEITGKPADIASVALHENNYDVSQAIQNIFDGQYEVVDTEWKTKLAKKRKPVIPGVEKMTNEEEVSENHVEEEDEEKITTKPGKPARSGRRGGRAKRSEEKAEEKPAESNHLKERDGRQLDGSDRAKSFERGKGRPRARGRGGAQRGESSRRGGFGGRGSFGPGRGAPRGRARGFGRRPRQDREWKGAPSNEVTNENAVDNLNEKESWDLDDNSGLERENIEWGLAAEAADAEWSHEAEQDGLEGGTRDNDRVAPVSEDNTASLFAMSMLPSSSKEDTWSHTNGPESGWRRPSPERQQEESLYRPEHVDTAVIKSQRAQPSSKPDSYSANEHSRPIYTSSHHNSRFPSTHQSTSLTSSFLGRNYNLESLAKASMQNNGEAVEGSMPAPMISGIHDSHTLEQEQIQPPKAQRQAKQKRTAKQQIPAQPVEMPKSFMEEIEQQLGGLEFGSGPSVSPKFGSESNAVSFGTSSTIVSTVFQQSAPVSITSTIQQEAVRHSVAVPESARSLPGVSTIQTSISTKSDRPKTPPGLKSLQDHSSPGRHFAPQSPRDLNRMVQMTDTIGFPANSRPTVPTLPVSTSLSEDDTMESSLSNSFPGARGAMNHGIESDQDTSATKMGSDQRSISSQGIMGLGVSTINSHLQQKPGSAFSSVADAFVAPNTSNKTATSLQTPSSTAFTKQNIVPGVLGSNSHVTYTSSALASQVLNSQLATSTATTQTGARTQASTSKASASGHHGMWPMNILPGMMPSPYTTYSYVDMPVMPRMPMPSFYDMGYPGATRESLGSSFQAGDSKFGRDASSPVASTINTGNIHAAHAHQQAAFLGAAAAPTPYGYAYYPPNVIPAMFTAPPTQMQAGKAHMVGAHYQSGYTSQHSSPAYNSAGGSQEFGKGAYHQTASQTLQQTKSNQGSGSLGTTSLTSENSHHTGFKGPFNQDSKGYQLTATPPSIGMQMPPAQNHMTTYTPYMMQHHTTLMQQGGHVSLDGSSQGSLVGQSGQHHGITSAQQVKRDTKGQPYRSSIWSATN